jgi:hypothetical protein
VFAVEGDVVSVLFPETVTPEELGPGVPSVSRARPVYEGH